jgi:hypothetical protein
MICTGSVAARFVLKEDFMTTAPTLFATLQQRLSYQTRERWLAGSREAQAGEAPGIFRQLLRVLEQQPDPRHGKSAE